MIQMPRDPLPSCLTRTCQVDCRAIDKPSLLADLLDAHLLACEGLTDIDFLGSQADAPAARDGDGAIMEGILQLR